MVNKKKAKPEIVKDYRKLIAQKQSIENDISNLGRERDLRVDAINAKYQFKIDKALRDLSMIDLMITASKTFVKEN